MVQELDLEQLDERELNARLQDFVGSGEQIVLRNTHARHNIAVNVHGALDIVVQGSAGFYCCGFMNGPTVLVTGNVGWYAADNMLGGKLIVQNNAGSNLAPSMIGGTVLVRGAAGSRVGYGLKGGTVVVCGDVGMLTGQQMLGGRIVVLGKVGANTGESMYGGVICYRHGAAAGIGNNVRTRPPEPNDIEALEWLFAENNISADPSEFSFLVPRGGKQKFHIFKPQFELRERVIEQA
ncbi:glutamate synthase [Anaerolineae bacterium CFX7]|nr:glutamate synthase [Anaerolineae bacterium CFX7]